MAGFSNSMPMNSFESTTTVNSRAPLTSACSSIDHGDENFAETHAYESPLEFQRELERERSKQGHRKKQCLLYEPTSVAARKLSDEGSDGVRYIHAHDRLYRTIFVLLFIFFLLSITLSTLALLGVHFRKSDCTCVQEAASQSASPGRTSYSRSSENAVISPAVQNNIMQSQRNFTYLYSVVIPELHAKIEELKKKAEIKVDISKLVGARGPPGPTGPIGPRGPSGAGNLSLCSHHSSSVSSAIPIGHPERAYAVTSRVNTSVDKVITGISCSSVEASETNLDHTRYSDGVDSYRCRCGGQASSLNFIPKDSTLHCFIHWWECPAIS